MSLITYDNPEIDEEDDRPIPVENKSYPYNAIADSRRFEELIYSLFSSEIKKGCFEKFDGISLMTGVREKGRDCALLKNGKNSGLIQCKKYNKNYSLDEFGKEITKFALYSLAEPGLIFDRTDFTYYIVVSTGFVYDCNEFINDFNNRILYEPKLDKWIQENVSSPTLKLVGLSNPKSDVINILSQIKVKPIVPADLDNLLAKPHNQHISSLFFQARTVVDNSTVERLEKKVDEYFINHTLTIEQILSQLSRGSITVKSQKNFFEGIPESHISRLETEELFTWSITPSPKDREGKALNICLLAANAGMGKTVIIKDLYDKLAKENIPVLALKADKLYSKSILQLQEKINLSIPVFDFVELCKQNFPQIIILIDQIDALSQSLSSERSYLDTFTQLIETYKHDNSVKIIISVRIFDLLYDPSLKVYKNLKSIEVKKLEEASVLSQLKKIGLEKFNISNNLLELLQVPNNLDVFSRIFNKERTFAGINSIQDLYFELWKYKVLNLEPSLNIDVNRLIDVLYAISKLMFERQQITVSEQIFDRYSKELNYLKTEQLLKFDNNEIQFFHQSFYDYVFAKRFVENKSSIKQYIDSQKQSIMVRSALKMILNYLREFDHRLYIKQFKIIIKDRKTFFHIKHLLISSLSTVENPSEEEKQIVLKYIIPYSHFNYIFYEHVKGKKWFEFLITNDLLDILIKKVDGKDTFYQKLVIKIKSILGSTNIDKSQEQRNLEICFQLLQRNLNNSSDLIIEFIYSKIDNEYFISRFLYNLKTWDNAKSFALLEKYPGIINSNDWASFHILQDILEYNPQYVFEKIKIILSKEQTNVNTHHEHQKGELLKKLIKKIPEPVITYFFEGIETEIVEKQVVYENTDIISDYAVNEIELKDNEHLPPRDLIYQLIAVELRKQASKGSDYFKQFLYKYKNSKYKGILKFVVFALQTNEEKYTSEIYELILYLSKARFFDSYGRLNYEIRNLLRSTFKFFNDEQLNNILKIIKKINVKSELHLWKNNDGKKKLSSFLGLTKYHFFNCIPEDLIKADKELNREYQELHRKYKNMKDNSGSSSFGGIVGPPLSANAYKYMNKKDWINSFKKYNTEHNFRSHVNEKDFLKGGLLEHSRAFSETVRNYPSNYLELIDTIINEKDIPIDYPIKGVDGLQKADFSPEIICNFLLKIIQKELNQSNIRECIWIADHLLATNNFNKEILDFIIYHALNNSDPEQKEITEKEINNNRKNGLVSTGINTIRGSAARALVFINDKKYSNEVFETLQKILEQDVDSVKAAILYQYAYLMNLDKDKAFKLFTSTVSKQANKNILPACIWSLQYLIHYDFKSLIPCLTSLVEMENLYDDDINSISSILFSAWLNEYPNSEELYKTFLDKHEKAHARAVADAFDLFYFKSEISLKSMEVLERFLKQAEEKVIKRFEIEFLHIEHIKFNDLYPFLVKYVSSKSFKISDYFLEYITHHSKLNPCECIDLFELAIKNDTLPNEQDGSFIRHEDSATKFIIGAYSSLRPNQVKKHKAYQLKLLKAFDRVLQDIRFKSNAENVLERVIG